MEVLEVLEGCGGPGQGWVQAFQIKPSLVVIPAENSFRAGLQVRIGPDEVIRSQPAR